MFKIHNISKLVKKEGLKLENLVSLCFYLAFPLTLLILGTFISSYVFTGIINLDINNSVSLPDIITTFSLPMLMFLAVIPVTVKCLLSKIKMKQLGFSSNNWLFTYAFSSLAALITILSLLLADTNQLEIPIFIIAIHYLFVAVSEEILVRGIVFYETNKMFTGILNCIINGIIFAFVYHSNENLYSNLIIRVPLGILLSYIRYRNDSLYPSIAIHWMYDCIITII